MKKILTFLLLVSISINIFYIFFNKPWGSKLARFTESRYKIEYTWQCPPSETWNKGCWNVQEYEIEKGLKSSIASVWVWGGGKPWFENGDIRVSQNIEYVIKDNKLPVGKRRY